MGRAEAGATGPRQTPRGQGGGETGRAGPPTPRRGPAPGRQKLTTLLDTGSPACGTRPTPGLGGFGSIRFAPLRDSIRFARMRLSRRRGHSRAARRRGCDSIRFAPAPAPFPRGGAPRGGGCGAWARGPARETAPGTAGRAAAAPAPRAPGPRAPPGRRRAARARRAPPALCGETRGRHSRTRLERAAAARTGRGEACARRSATWLNLPEEQADLKD